MGATENAGSDAKLQRNLELDLWSSFEITKMPIAVSEKDLLVSVIFSRLSLAALAALNTSNEHRFARCVALLARTEAGV